MSFSIDQSIRKADRFAKSGKTERAIKIYRDVIAKSPTDKRALKGLKTLNHTETLPALSNEAPFEEKVKFLATLYDQGQLKDALRLAETLISKCPKTVILHNFLGAINAGLGHQKKAVERYKSAVQIEPNFAEAHNNLGVALKALGRHSDSVESYTRALQLKPDYAEAHNNLGNALRNLGKIDDAIDSYAKAIKLHPEFSQAYNNTGNAYKELGQVGAAIENYTKALEINPDFAEAHSNLSTVKKYKPGDIQIVRMLNQVEQKTLSDKDKRRLNFALGKAYGDTGDEGKSFSFLSEGNRFQKLELKYKIATDQALFSKIKSTFSNLTPTLNFPVNSYVSNIQRPLFILGMPRSGTSLVEQILASHSKVHGAGELELLNQCMQNFSWVPFQFNTEYRKLIREPYLLGLKNLHTTEPFITDKMPLNFRWLGFIRHAFPEAKIVHVTRDARATCWSIFKTSFNATGLGFSNDLFDISEYYKLYIDLMAFWREQYPGWIYDLNYESLTLNQDEETRKLLEYMDLEWEPQCLKFYETSRAVRTASATQVRQKMYHNSSDEWLKFKRFIAPMIQNLKEF